MSTRTTRLLLLVGIAVVAAFAAAMAILAFGGNDTATKADYQATVVNARDRVDYALYRITKSTSEDELIERLNEASAVIGATARTLDDAAVAKGFEAENAKLVDTLRSFSDELAATADQFSDPTLGPAFLNSINSLGFSQWEDVNAILTQMNAQGLKVQLLQRH